MPEPKLRIVKDDHAPTDLALAYGIDGNLETLGVMRQFVFSGLASQRMRDTALELVRGIDGKDDTGQVAAIFGFVRDQIEFREDPLDTQLVQSPEYTLSHKAGDCVDKSILLAVLLAAIGFKSRFVILAQQLPNFNHVYVDVWLANQWVALEATNEGAYQLGEEAPGMKRLAYQIFDPDEGVQQNRMSYWAKVGPASRAVAGGVASLKAIDPNARLAGLWGDITGALSGAVTGFLTGGPIGAAVGAGVGAGKSIAGGADSGHAAQAASDAQIDALRQQAEDQIQQIKSGVVQGNTNPFTAQDQAQTILNNLLATAYSVTNKEVANRVFYDQSAIQGYVNDVGTTAKQYYSTWAQYHPDSPPPKYLAQAGIAPATAAPGQPAVPAATTGFTLSPLMIALIIGAVILLR